MRKHKNQFVRYVKYIIMRHVFTDILLVLGFSLGVVIGFLYMSYFEFAFGNHVPRSGANYLRELHFTEDQQTTLKYIIHTTDWISWIYSGVLFAVVFLFFRIDTAKQKKLQHGFFLIILFISLFFLMRYGMSSDTFCLHGNIGKIDKLDDINRMNASFAALSSNIGFSSFFLIVSIWFSLWLCGMLLLFPNKIF